MPSSKSSFFYTVVCGPRLNLPHQAFARQKSTASGRVDGTWVEPHKYLHLLTMKHSSVNVTLTNPKVSECAVDWSRLAYPALMEDLFQAGLLIRLSIHPFTQSLSQQPGPSPIHPFFHLHSHLHLLWIATFFT